MPTAKRDKEWFKCAQCGHKLGRMVGVWHSQQAMPAIEVKCHSCKTINYLLVGGQKNK